MVSDPCHPKKNCSGPMRKKKFEMGKKVFCSVQKSPHEIILGRDCNLALESTIKSNHCRRNNIRRFAKKCILSISGSDRQKKEKLETSKNEIDFILHRKNLRDFFSSVRYWKGFLCDVKFSRVNFTHFKTGKWPYREIY